MDGRDAPDGDWRVVREESRPGPMQMALDEVAAETAADGGPWTVRVYRWEPSCFSLGYRQDPATVDWAFCEREGVDVTRRQTGGGGIYHDNAGDVAYSITVPTDAVPGKLLDCYHLLCEPVLDAFERVGIDADYVDREVPEIYHPACYLRELHPAHDVVAGGSDADGPVDDAGGSTTDAAHDSEGDAAADEPADWGRKIAGNAQYRRKEGVIQHGSLTYSVDAERHLGVFDDPPVSPEEFRERVVGVDELVDIDRAEFVETLEEALADWAGATEGSWTDAELAAARERAEEKYRADDWVRARPGDRD